MTLPTLFHTHTEQTLNYPLSRCADLPSALASYHPSYDCSWDFYSVQLPSLFQAHPGSFHAMSKTQMMSMQMLLKQVQSIQDALQGSGHGK